MLIDLISAWATFKNKQNTLLNIMFHALVGRFQLELF